MVHEHKTGNYVMHSALLLIKTWDLECLFDSEDLERQLNACGKQRRFINIKTFMFLNYDTSNFSESNTYLSQQKELR